MGPHGPSPTTLLIKVQVEHTNPCHCLPPGKGTIVPLPRGVRKMPEIPPTILLNATLMKKGPSAALQIGSSMGQGCKGIQKQIRVKITNQSGEEWPKRCWLVLGLLKNTNGNRFLKG